MVGLFVDYVVFGLLIAVTFAFTIYSTLAGPKQNTKADYVFASGKTVSIWAMLLSIARGFLGVRVFLGYPSEFFYRGSEMWETVYGTVIAFPLVAFFFVPVYFSLGITSVYQYLDLRFKSRLVRCLAAGTYILRGSLNLGVTLFTPCVALKTVIGMPYAISIIGISLLGIFFTVTGGLRSAIMADVIQTLGMIGCSIVVIFQGVIEAKGPANVVKISHERGRLDFFNFDLDPTVRVTTISALFGQLFMALSLYGCQQSFVQRYISLKTQKRVNKTLWLNVPFMAVLFSLSWVVGMVIFANYADCDPKLLGYISHIDEILPFYIEDKFVFLPGFLGLTMACLFNGCLSFFVSNLNSLATVVWEDFLSLLPPLKNINDSSQLFIIKICAVILGLCIMGIAFIVSQFSGVIESSMLMTSATSGPLLGAFILAMFIPFANWKGASTGMIIAHIATLWITFGSFTIDKPPVKYLPTTTDGCTNETFSSHIRPFNSSFRNTILQSTIASNDSEFSYDYADIPFNIDRLDIEIKPSKSEGIITSLYRITYMYYAMFGTLVTVFVGALVSYITGVSEEFRFNQNLIHPLARKVCSWFPGHERCYESNICKTKSVNSINLNKENSTNQKITISSINEKHLPNDFPIKMVSCDKIVL